MANADSKSSDHLAADVPLFHSDALRPRVVADIHTAIQALWQQHPAAQDREVKLTLLLTWGVGGESDSYCHAEPLPPRPTPPIKLQVRGLPRVNARAKDSEWVRQRKALEASKPDDVDEVCIRESRWVEHGTAWASSRSIDRGLGLGWGVGGPHHWPAGGPADAGAMAQMGPW